MEDVRGGDGACAANADAGREMPIRADATAGDDRKGDGLRHPTDEREIVAVAGTVAVDRVEEDLAGTESLDLLRPGCRVAPGRTLAVGGVNFVAAIRTLLGVDRDDDALRPVAPRSRNDETRVVERGGIDDDFVGAGGEALGDISERAHAAAEGERHETDFRHFA